ncbi:isocitrate lyase/PEP mutase family protein [Methylobacterium sp. JK268]
MNHVETESAAARQNEKARLFAALHRSGAPVILYNVWDAGSAKAVAGAGAAAIATGSAAVAAAQGYPDGEQIPMTLALAICARIVASTDLPVTVDFEGAYAREPDGVRESVGRLIATGAVGLNLEDGIVGERGLYAPNAQAGRIAAARAAADGAGVGLFVNARTDLFLQEPEPRRHAGLLDEAVERARIYAQAGANGFFVPGLIDPDLIARLCAAVALPLNVMAGPHAPSRDTLARAGVSRISHGPHPHAVAMQAVGAAARTALGPLQDG